MAEPYRQEPAASGGLVVVKPIEIGPALLELARAYDRRTLPPLIVVSYADTREQHYGYIYRALNFRYAGWTDMDRKTPRKDYIPIDPTAHTRDAFRGGYSHTVPRLPKVKYWLTTGNHSERRRLDALCGWPVMDWHKTPPPLFVAVPEPIAATA